MGWTTKVQFPVVAIMRIFFSVLHTDWLWDPISYPVGTRGSYAGGKATKA